MKKLPFEGDPPIPSTAKLMYGLHTADFVGLYSYTATGGAEFGPPPLGGPCAPPRAL